MWTTLFLRINNGRDVALLHRAAAVEGIDGGRKWGAGDITPAVTINIDKTRDGEDDPAMSKSSRYDICPHLFFSSVRDGRLQQTTRSIATQHCSTQPNLVKRAGAASLACRSRWPSLHQPLNEGCQSPLSPVLGACCELWYKDRGRHSPAGTLAIFSSFSISFPPCDQIQKPRVGDLVAVS